MPQTEIRPAHLLRDRIDARTTAQPGTTMISFRDARLSQQWDITPNIPSHTQHRRPLTSLDINRDTSSQKHACRKAPSLPLPPSDTLNDSEPPLPSPTSSTIRSSRYARIPRSTWLMLYFTLNLGLTLFNKLVLAQFPFPYTLTAIHAFWGTIGIYWLTRYNFVKPAQLGNKDRIIVGAFSLLYTVNIAVSNASLQLVTVAFHQVVRAATPILTALLSTAVFGTKISLARHISLVPVIVGIMFTTYGDYYFTPWGFSLTFLGTMLAATKTVLTNLLQTRASSTIRFRDTFISVSLPRLHPLQLLGILSPLSFIQCVLLAYCTGELENVRQYAASNMSFAKATTLSTNGCLAFALNVVSFIANKEVGPITMSVAGNVKQALTIIFAMFIFDLQISPMNALGILLTLFGGVWYAYVDAVEKRIPPRS